jgi:hypothetical protein
MESLQYNKYSVSHCSQRSSVCFSQHLELLLGDYYRFVEQKRSTATTVPCLELLIHRYVVIQGRGSTHCYCCYRTTHFTRLWAIGRTRGYLRSHV